MDIGVREFKEHLSEYLDRAERGELIRVTDRGRPKVLISPIPDAGRLQQGVEEGWLRAPARPGGLAPATQRAPSDRRLLDVLNEDRGD